MSEEVEALVEAAVRGVTGEQITETAS